MKRRLEHPRKLGIYLSDVVIGQLRAGSLECKVSASSIVESALHHFFTLGPDEQRTVLESGGAALRRRSR
jgi:hypothetical protein